MFILINGLCVVACVVSILCSEFMIALFTMLLLLAYDFIKIRIVMKRYEEMESKKEYMRTKIEEDH